MGSVGCGAWTVDKSSKTVSREKTRERERERRIVSRGQVSDDSELRIAVCGVVYLLFEWFANCRHHFLARCWVFDGIWHGLLLLLLLVFLLLLKCFSFVAVVVFNCFVLFCLLLFLAGFCFALN